MPITPATLRWTAEAAQTHADALIVWLASRRLPLTRIEVSVEDYLRDGDDVYSRGLIRCDVDASSADVRHAVAACPTASYSHHPDDGTYGAYLGDGCVAVIHPRED